ncbi:MAG TPA: hypothetical protein VFI37_08655 [Gaiellaceae bacterium]|jgi:succinate-acetate transporter protein|nr:hypothetical protein [Gaiellaceae bacterium]
MDDRVQITMRPIATPVPLTFLGLAIATTIVSGTELGWIPPVEVTTAGWALLGVPGPLQLLAAAWSFPGRSAGTATGSAVLAGVWFGFGLVFVNGGAGNHPALGMMLAAAAAALLVPAAAELTAAVVPAAVLLATATRFGISAVYHLSGSSDWKHAAGYAGLVVAALALYGALALELEAALGRDLLPVWPLGQGKVAREGSLVDQLRGIETSPGVRRKL